MSIKTFKNLSFEQREGVGILSLNRPKKLNALNREVLEELKEFFVIIHRDFDFSLRGLIFTGAGEKAFMAGADIAEMANMASAEADQFAKLGQQVTLLMEGLKIPIIAGVNGLALGGGCEMALACDFIFATNNALFGQPEVKLGLIPGFGGTQRLANYVGRNKARELIYTGRNIDAAEAQELGLTLKTFAAKDEMISAARKTIGLMAKNSPKAIGIAKKVMNFGNDLNLGEALSREREHFANLFHSYDTREGTNAFVEKRKPVFTGN